MAFGLGKGYLDVPELINQWKGKLAYIIPSMEQSGIDHATIQTPENQNAATLPPSKDEKGIYGIYIGQSSHDVLSLLGAPQRKDPSAFGYEWWVYNNEGSHYIQIGIQNNNVVDLYSPGRAWNFKGIHKGSTEDQLHKVFSIKPTVTFTYDRAEFTIKNILNERPLVILNDIPTLFYLDKHDQNKVVGIRFMTKEWLVKSKLYSIEWTYYKTPPDVYAQPLSAEQQNSDQRATEEQIFDLVNVVRTEYGLPTLQWNEGAATVARGHSLDMLEHHYFDHVSSTTGMDPFERMKKNGIKFRTAGENIAMGYMDAIEVHHGWMNSLGHRKNILHPDFKTLGVGVVRNYSTQNFVTPW